jgi:hypothetical protein
MPGIVRGEDNFFRLPAAPARRYHAAMSRAPYSGAVPVTARPTVLDYVLVLLGCGVSLLLLPVTPLQVAAHDDVRPAWLRPVIEALPGAMRLTEGVVLLWPAFLTFQVLRGRGEAPTAAEWLWIVSWLGVVTLTVLGLWEHHDAEGMPEPLRDLITRYPLRRLWYVLFVPAMGFLSLVLVLASALSRKVPPWTHGFALALTLWPALLMGVLLASADFVSS